MISCRQRREERERSIESLEAQGVTVTVAESPCDPASRRENRRVGCEALEAAPPGRGVLFCEDDIRANGRLPAFLDMAASLDAAVVMCLLRDACLSPETQSEVASGRPMRPRLERIRVRNWYGTQCVYLPRRVIDAALSHPTRSTPRPGLTKWDGIDFLIRDVLLERGEPLFVALPNPVQHTAPPSVVAGKPPARVSSTAGLRADRPMSMATVDDWR